MPYVSVYVDIDDVLNEASDEELREELQSRHGKSRAGRDDELFDIYETLMRGDVNGALAMLARLAFPAEQADRAKTYARAKENRDAATGRPVIP